LPSLARPLAGAGASSFREQNEEESMMTKLLISLLGAGVIATAGYAAASSVDTDPARTVSLPGATTSDDATTATTATAAVTTDGVEDVSGPCDEAEHRSDPRCAGTSAPAPAPAPAPAVTTADDDGPGDISGPCDEAEHRNDARCTGVAATDDGAADDRGADDAGDDSSGHGSGGDDGDRSGSNSGEG
jgi:hypothetical protein